MSVFNYTQEGFLSALRSVGLREGDTVFTHSNIGYFGMPDSGAAADALEIILGGFQKAIGPEGTLIVPTFTYSFPKNEVFDPLTSPSACGAFSEKVRKHPASRRSEDPFFSVAALGKKAGELTAGVSDECFGEDSFWARFLAADGRICNLNFDAGSTFIHYVEKTLQAPYRQDRVFSGAVVKESAKIEKKVIFYSQDLAVPDTAASFELFHEAAKKIGIVYEARMGRGSILRIDAKDTQELIRRVLPKHPFFLIERGRGGPVP